MLIQAILIILYPLVLHAGVIMENVHLMLLSMIFLSTGLFYKQLVLKDRLTFLIYITFNLSLFSIYFFGYVSHIVLLPPLLVPILLFLVFGRTLLANEVPLVTAIGEWARGPLSEGMKKYTRKVTQIWSLVFLLLFLEAIVLTLWGSLEIWSWFTNLFNHLFVGILFFGEFVWRKKQFPDHDHPSFLDYLKIVIRSRQQMRQEDIKS